MTTILTRLPRIRRTRTRAHTTLTLYAGLWLLTGLIALAAVAAPSLAPSRAPHATLRPTASAITSILLNNARVLAPPFLLALFGFGTAPSSRAFADVLVAAPQALLALTVGVAVGRWGERLLPYLPQLPIEYAAAAVAANVWVTHRQGARPPTRSLARDAGIALGLLAIAATLEALATPHAR